MICSTCNKDRKNAKYCCGCGKALLSNGGLALLIWHRKRHDSAAKRLGRCTVTQAVKTQRTITAHAAAISWIEWALEHLPDPESQFGGPPLPGHEKPTILEVTESAPLYDASFAGPITPPLFPDAP